ncbi:unnamed protein product, partial [Rotaria magnacalcarata]
ERKNTNNANASGDEIDAEIGDSQLPLTINPYNSSTLSPNIIIPSQEIPYQRNSTSSLQYNVVLHSNVNEPLLPATKRFDLNLPFDTVNRTELNRKANSLMTVYEHSSMNDTGIGESASKSDTYRARSPSSVSDSTFRRTAHVQILAKDT